MFGAGTLRLMLAWTLVCTLQTRLSWSVKFCGKPRCWCDGCKKLEVQPSRSASIAVEKAGNVDIYVKAGSRSVVGSDKYKVELQDASGAVLLSETSNGCFTTTYTSRTPTNYILKLTCRNRVLDCDLTAAALGVPVPSPPKLHPKPHPKPAPKLHSKPKAKKSTPKSTPKPLLKPRSKSTPSKRTPSKRSPPKKEPPPHRRGAAKRTPKPLETAAGSGGGAAGGNQWLDGPWPPTSPAAKPTAAYEGWSADFNGSYAPVNVTSLLQTSHAMPTIAGLWRGLAAAAAALAVAAGC